MSDEYPEAVRNACKIFPGSTHIIYEYQWKNKYNGSTYTALPANARISEYRQQRRVTLTAMTAWENYDEEG